MPRAGLRTRGSTAAAEKENIKEDRNARKERVLSPASKVVDDVKPVNKEKEEKPLSNFSGRRMSGRKRKSVEAEEEEEVDGLSVEEKRKQKAKYEGMLEEFDHEVERKVKSLRSHAESSCSSIRIALQVELVKLPKNIKSMTIREFKEKYGIAPQQQAQPSSSTRSKPVPGLPTKGAPIMQSMGESKLDFSGINVTDFNTLARKDIFSKMNSALAQFQTYSVADKK